MRSAAPLRETAYAKINLALHVRQRMADGYHRIETLFAFAEDGDVLTARGADTACLTIDGSCAEGLPTDDGNLVVRAAHAFSDAFGEGKEATFHLQKNLPVASGIGGGSADAAAALRLLCNLWAVDLGDARVLRIATGLGADIPACLVSKTCIGTGRGDELQPVNAADIANLPILLVNPGATLETPAVYRGWDGVDLGGLGLNDRVAVDPAWRNDLQQGAIDLVPEIGSVLEAMNVAEGVRFAAMSGSGATCFALFDSFGMRDSAANDLAKRHPDWWIMASALR